MDTYYPSNYIVKEELNEEEQVRSEDEESLVLSPNLGGQRIIDFASNRATDRNIIYFGQSFPSFSEVSMSVRKYESANRVRLSQKYFRRIAANPKPSNKDDYMLTENERKRFVYRWVDFCCTYFDELVIHGGNHLPAEGGEDTPSFGYTKKECPMRIRFQMRFREKDLTVSIFRESHDHEPPVPDPEKEHLNLPLLSEGINYDPASSSKQNRSHDLGPPSLTPVPKMLVKMRKRNSLKCNSVIEKAFIPKPPPLKKGSISVSTQSVFASNNKTTESESEDLDKVKLSAQTIIKNVHRYLHRTSAYGSNMKNGIVFTSPNPNIIKLTADLCNVDEKVVLDITSTNPIQKAVASTDNQCHISTSCYVDVKNSKKRNGSSSMSSMPKKTYKVSSGVLRLQHRPSDMHTDEEFDNQPCGNLPLEVIIKTEPDAQW
ncbi:unnamed protein product [Orchesella dallaii]|uniref:Uncharacterized protein n=1 Tax=Orchesella dallaii TaxID=48710 RepID=A0ABP1PTD2_9HEXA